MSPSDIRFAADGMLQSLGTWLRLMGYDCIGSPTLHSRPLLERSVAEDRVYLTRNAHLADNLPHDLLSRAEICFVEAEHLPGQVREVAMRFSLDPDRFAFSRCLNCNVVLHPVSSAEAMATGAVPPKVAVAVQSFWRCSICRKVFWQGSHVTNSLDRLQRWLAK